MHLKRLLFAPGTMPLTLVLSGIGACAPLPAPVRAEAPADAQTHRAVAYIDARMEEAAAKGFGGAIIVKRGGAVLLSKGYGFANRQRKIPFTPETVAQIGSITKSQTAATIATLIAEGKIALSDSVARFVPDAPEPGRSRTVAQLLSHNSGLADTCADDFDELSEAELVKRCLAMPLAHTPGEDNYSNMGYSVLALIIQRVTGKSWEDAVRERVWRPLGLRHIGFYFDGPSDAFFAHGYLKMVEQPIISRSVAALRGNDWALRGNGGVQASSKTMIRFLDSLVDRRGGLPAAARKLILSPVPGQSGDVREGFGLAFRFNPSGRLLRMAHSGSDGVFFSYLAWVPANNVRFYFVGNNGEDEVKPVLGDVLAAAMDLPPQ